MDRKNLSLELLRLAKALSAEIPTFRLNNGVEVFAKMSDGELHPVGYGNRTQAQKKVAELGEGWAVYRGTYGRPFYVGKSKTASTKTAALTDEHAVNLVKKKNDLLSKIDSHAHNIREGLQDAEDQINGLQKAGGGSIDASVVLRKNVLGRVTGMRDFLDKVAKQLE